MKKIVLLSTDTLHHRYFINYLINRGVDLGSIFFETNKYSASFATGPLFELDEKKFEKDNFFKTISDDLPNIDIYNVKSLNNNESHDLLKKTNPDFGIVFGTGKIKKNIIKLFPDGLINVHRGFAQLYRGLDSDLWAIYHRDYSNIGVTIHFVESALDTGDIVYQDRLNLQRGMQTHQIRYYTTLIASELICKSINDYLSNSLRSFPQVKRGRYYSFMPLELKKIVNKRFNKYCKVL